MCEVSCAYEVQALGACETGDFAYGHLLARGTAVLAVDVEVSNHPQLFRSLSPRTFQKLSPNRS